MYTFSLSYKAKQRFKHSRTIIHSFVSFFFIICVFCSCHNVLADEVLNGISYQTTNDNSYKNMINAHGKMSYGKSSLGPVVLNRSSSQGNKAEKNGIDAYSADNSITIGYKYYGNFKTKNENEWHIVSDNGKVVNDCNLGKRIQNGVVIIRKSYDLNHWDYATEPITNFFSNSKVDRDKLYTIYKEDLVKGTYFELIIAYKIERKDGEKPGFLGIKTPNMIYRYCMEYYKFFAYYEGNPVEFKDINSNKILADGSSVNDGFTINKKGSRDVIRVAKDSGVLQTIDSVQSFTEPGVYKCIIEDPVGKKYKHEVTVTEGMHMTNPLTGKSFWNNKKSGYQENMTVETVPVKGMHTQLVLGQSPETAVLSKGTVNNVQAFGVTGTGLNLYLRLKNNLPNGWEIVSDDYGKKDKETIMGVRTGPIKSGALIIMVSTDNRNYRGISVSNYRQGLSTTDFEFYYDSEGDVLIYSPSGQDILNGIYIKVYYAYEIKNPSTKADIRCLERYWFYLCSDNLDAVTFHNMSVGDDWYQELEGYDEATAEISKHTETMLSNAYTVSGFQIDNKLNPVVTYTVSRNDEQIKNPSNQKNFSASGRYTINLKSPVKTEKTVVLYVDRMSDEEAFEYYFGESFIHGKRIFSEGQYPVYEGGKTSYYLESIDDYHVPLAGYIRNVTTDEMISIAPDRNGTKGELIKPGEYIAVFSTNPDYEKDPQSGDARIFTFHFRIIAEGTAPGPVVNQKNLSEYAHTSITDSYPVYYGLTYTSSTKGHITLAFASEEEAIQYAENEYEPGIVEPQSDGSYRYAGSFNVTQKEKYDSNWDLMDAIHFFAKEAVQKLYFDNSDKFTTLSLRDELVRDTENIRKLELDRSVFIFYDNQKELLTDLKTLPIISPKPYQYLEPGKEGKIDSGFDDFEFISDKYRCDSDSVSIIDVNGKEYPIRYHEGVGKQLQKNNCPSGIVTIRETTVYGDTSEYQAVFIADGENTSALNMTLYTSDEREKRTFTQADDEESITVNAFSINDITDPLDPYNLILIRNKKDHSKDAFYVADKLSQLNYDESGNYSIVVVNRLGFSYSLNVNIEESDKIMIYFSGAGTEGLHDIETDFGAKKVKLPSLSRYGYDFLGFEDENGNLYSREIAEILFKGSSVLNAVWKAKEVNLTLQDAEGEIIQKDIVRFGDEFILPKNLSPDTGELITWTMNGQPLSDNKILIDQENDIVLISSVTGNKNDQKGTDDQLPKSSGDLDKEIPNDSDSLAKTYLNIAVWIFAGCTVVIIIILIYKTAQKKKIKKVSEDSQQIPEEDKHEAHNVPEKNIEIEGGENEDEK